MEKLLLLLMLLAATRGSGEEGIEPRPPKHVMLANELARLISDTRVGEPQRYKNLTIFPLFTSGRATRGYWTLDQALAKGVLRISEKGEGSVPELLAENLSEKPVFLMAGEIVTGGKQNRVVSQDILLSPRSGPTGLGVFCVEQGRWTQQTRFFGVEKEMAHGVLRQQLNAPMVSQSAVWGEVARKAGAVAAAQPNETHYLGRIYEDKDVRREVDDYSQAVAWTEDASGMAVLIGGSVVGVEIFGDSEMFARLRDKLVRSYAVDAIEFSDRARPAPDQVAVEQFLQSARQAQLSPKETIGLGRLCGVEARAIYGSVLIWHQQKGAHGVVHASLFADSKPESRPPIVPRPTPRPFREIPERYV